MSTYAEFITKCENRVENANTRTTPYLQEATIRWLKELSNIHVLFMEDTFEFDTVAGQSEYGPGDTDFPLDVMTFQTIYREDGSDSGAQRTIIPGPEPIENVRACLTPVTAGYPEMWAWHHDKLIFAPYIQSVMTIKGDYVKDATRDEETGVVIATDSTTHTNAWFDRGEHVLMNVVLWDYYSAIAKDQEAAALCRVLYQDGLKSLRRDYQAKAVRSAAADYWWGDY